MLDDDEREFYRAWKADGKRRHREHVARNMEAYQKYVNQMAKLGFEVAEVGSGFRFTHVSGLRIDFWKQSGKWTEVGTNVYKLGPTKMVKFAKARTQVSRSDTDRGNYGDLREDLKKVNRRSTHKPVDPNAPPWEVE